MQTPIDTLKAHIDTQDVPALEAFCKENTDIYAVKYGYHKVAIAILDKNSSIEVLNPAKKAEPTSNQDENHSEETISAVLHTMKTLVGARTRGHYCETPPDTQNSFAECYESLVPKAQRFWLFQAKANPLVEDHQLHKEINYK